jgi:hypothetical protein
VTSFHLNDTWFPERGEKDADFVGEAKQT